MWSVELDRNGFSDLGESNTQVNITQKRARRPVFSQQVIIRLQGTDKTVNKSNEEGKYQEAMEESTAPDPGHH